MAAQVASARERALAVPAVGYAAMVITGSDRRSWLNGLITCDVSKIEPGQAVYGLAVAQKGRILADLIVVAEAERLLVVVPSSTVDVLREMFDRHLIMEDAEITAASDLGVFFVHGPKATAALDAARAAGGTGGVLDMTGLGGAIVFAPSAVEAQVRAALAGNAAMGDDAGWDALRLERGVPRFGVDFDGAMYPQEASLEKRAVSFDKGCYLGQEVVCMLEMRGHVKRKLVPLVLTGGEVPAKGAPVTTDAGDAIGEVSSATKSPSLGVPVALAMVKYAFASPGTEVRVGGGRATLVERPA